MKTLKSQGDAYNICLSLKNFQVVYILYFLIGIHKIVSTLSMEFKNCHMDVACIWGLATIAIGDVKEKFLHHV